MVNKCIRRSATKGEETLQAHEVLCRFSSTRRPFLVKTSLLIGKWSSSQLFTRKSLPHRCRGKFLCTLGPHHGERSQRGDVRMVKSGGMGIHFGFCLHTSAQVSLDGSIVFFFNRTRQVRGSRHDYSYTIYCIFLPQRAFASLLEQLSLYISYDRTLQFLHHQLHFPRLPFEVIALLANRTLFQWSHFRLPLSKR